jgi:hypothetical protein
MNRRELLRNAALVAGALPAAGALVSRPADAHVVSDAAPAADGPWWLLAPYTVGQHIAFGWTLGLLEPLDRGALVLNLHNGDAGARLHLCYHQGNPKGVAHSELLDVILMDGGQGDQSTDESLGRVMRHLANVMRQNELRDDGAEQLARLMTHTERVETFGPESLL